MNAQHLLIYENIRQCVTLSGVAAKQGRNPCESDLGLIENAAIVVDSESSEIVWVGKTSDQPKEYLAIENRFSDNNEVWLPEFVECHTHLVYGGNRHSDFAARCRGKTYQEIAAGGGGILTTLKHTRELSESELIERALPHIDRFQKTGVGVIEIKTGYGLDLKSELKVLRVIAALSERSSVTLVPTFMPAHAVPPEFSGKADAFIDVVCTEWIPEVAKQNLADFVDAFIEQGFFTTAQAERVLSRAKEAGLGLKLHVDQFSDLGGIEMGIALGVTSLDHLETVSDANIKRIADSSTTAVLCPGASLFTKTPYAPARKLIDAGARVALSTDFNPGTCPSKNLPLMTTLACTQMNLTVAESLAAITYNAASAVGLEEVVGSIEPGKLFRVCQLHGESYEVLPYSFGELD